MHCGSFFAGVVVLLSACGGPETSPFILWGDKDIMGELIQRGGIRTGMPLDSLEQFFVQRDGLPQNARVWDRCTPLDAGARRCERRNGSPDGRLEVVVASDSRVVYMAFAPSSRDIAFDDSLSRMQQRWVRARGVKQDPHGVSEANPHGVAGMRSGRWRAFMTFDGKLCEGTTRPCPALIQLVDWSAGRKYADMTVPH